MRFLYMSQPIFKKVECTSFCLSKFPVGELILDKGGDSIKARKGGLKKVATQLSETPTLYGDDAQAVLDQIATAPSKEQVEKLKKDLTKKFVGIEKRGLR